MAIILNRIQTKCLMHLKNGFHYPKAKLFTFHNSTIGRKFLLTTSGLIGIGSVGIVYALNQSVNASGLELNPPSYAWDHKPCPQSCDHSSIGRGKEVYQQACAACHSFRFVSNPELIGE